jgi:hypothetical protein
MLIRRVEMMLCCLQMRLACHVSKLSLILETLIGKAISSMPLSFAKKPAKNIFPRFLPKKRMSSPEFT